MSSRSERRAAALATGGRAPDPEMRYLIVVHGASRMSSWSMPIMLAPLRRRTPTTSKRHVLHAHLLADRRLVAEQLALSVWPSTQTLLPLRTSRSVKRSPSAIAQSRTSRNSGVVPDDLHRHPVLVAVDDLALAAHDRGDGADGGALAADRLGVLGRQRHDAAAARS